MSSRLTEKEARLLTACMNNVNGGASAIINLIDFSKVFEPAGYKDVRNAKIMFTRLMSKIVDDGLDGAPGRYKPGRKAKEGSAEGDEGMESSPLVAATPVKPSKKRKVASEIVEENTPTKRVRVAPKGSKGAIVDAEEVLSDGNGISGNEATGAVEKEEGQKQVLSTTEDDNVL